MAGDRGVGVAVNVGAPFPARRVGVTGTDELGLKAFEFLLRTKFVRHGDGFVVEG